MIRFSGFHRPPYLFLDSLVEDLFCYHPGFAGAGASEDELYAGVGDGVELGGGEGHGYLILCGCGEKGRGEIAGRLRGLESK